MIIKRVDYYSFLFALAYILSVLYFPLEVGGTSIVSRLAPLFLLSVIAINNLRLKYTVHVYTIILFLCLLLGGVSSLHAVHSLLFYLNFVLLSLATYLACNHMFEQFGYEFLYKSLRIIVLFSVIVSALGVLEFYYYESTLKLWFFRGSPYYYSKGQVSSFYSNPNIFGIITAISLQLVFIVYRANYMRVSFSVICLLVLLLGVFYSEARMAYAIAILVIVYQIAHQIFYRQWLSPFLMVLISYSVLLLMSLKFDYLLSYIDLNFRDVVWAASRDIFYDNLIFGVGMGNLQDTISNYDSSIDWQQGANNYVWGFLAECGLFFFLLFSFVILKVFWGKSKLNCFYSDASFLISVMLISQFSEHFLLYVSPFVMIFFLMLTIMSKTSCGFKVGKLRC